MNPLNTMHGITIMNRKLLSCFMGLVALSFIAQNVSAQVTINVGSVGKTSKKIEKAEKKPAEETLIEPTFTAQGGFENSLERAKQSAILVARDQFQEYLRNQEESINREPSTELIRRMLINTQEKVETTTIKSDLSNKPDTMYRVTVAVKVESEHLRLMRTRDRSSEALGVIGIIAMVLFLIAGFFRLDMITKGYITRWLFFGMIGIGALVLGVWGYTWPW